MLKIHGTELNLNFIYFCVLKLFLKNLKFLFIFTLY